MLARGSGSSLAGQAIGPAVIIDCARYLNQIEEISRDAADDPELGGSARLEPGVLISNLNKKAKPLGLQYGPDPASAERATIAGSIANNAAGAHSIQHGMAADHLVSIQVSFADGSQATLGNLEVREIERLGEEAGGNGSTLGALYRATYELHAHQADVIRDGWPNTWRVASGYLLNYLLPWSSTQPPQWSSDGNNQRVLPYPPIAPGTLNLACLLAGSEGTLAVMHQATVRLVPLPRATILGVLSFDSISAACDAVTEILERAPSAIELIPRTILSAARSVPAYAPLCDFISGDPAAILVVEFSGEDQAQLRQKVLELSPDVIVAEKTADQNKVWAVRKVGLGLLNARHGDTKPTAFIEDLSVPVGSLGKFVREMERIMAEQGTYGEVYAHASAGCLHIRPVLNLKSIEGLAALNEIARRAVELTISLGGSVSGEHGDGLARSQWLEQQYGSELYGLMKSLKDLLDPRGLLNPGKIVGSAKAPVAALDQNLRYGSSYRAQGWTPVMDFSHQAGLSGAIEQCNGAAVCRKEDGVMCPSYQATRDEMHSTRGRANLLRAMISGQIEDPRQAEELVHEALDLCLACKGCKAECPSSVDVAKLRYEFSQYYYSSRAAEHHSRPLRDYLFGYIGALGRMAHPLAPVATPLMRSRAGKQVIAKIFRLDSRRAFPAFSSRSLRGLYVPARQKEPAGDKEPVETVLFLSDPFTEYFQPEVGLAALRALERAGCRVTLVPTIGSGRTFISKGFLEKAKIHARKLVDMVTTLDPQGKLLLVGVEPSEVYSLLDEYLDFFPDDPRVKYLAEHSFLVDEFLLRPGPDGEARLKRLLEADHRRGTAREPAKRRVLLHGHCYQKAQAPAADGYPVGVAASREMLESCGYQVQVIEAGCCGMAGAFGYESEHYDLSMKVGELALFPAIRNATEKYGEDFRVAATGVSCQGQIQDGAGKKALHPIQLVYELIEATEV